jgi:hypothetical protein
MLVLKRFKLGEISDIELKDAQPVCIIIGEDGIPGLGSRKTSTEIETYKNGDMAHVTEPLPSKGKDMISN